jgi:hypothetical protein
VHEAERAGVPPVATDFGFNWPFRHAVFSAVEQDNLQAYAQRVGCAGVDPSTTDR